MKWFDSITGSMDINLSKLWKVVEDRGACNATVHEITELNTHDLATEQQKQHSDQNLEKKKPENNSFIRFQQYYENTQTETKDSSQKGNMETYIQFSSVTQPCPIL